MNPISSYRGITTVDRIPRLILKNASGAAHNETVVPLIGKQQLELDATSGDATNIKMRDSDSALRTGTYCRVFAEAILADLCGVRGRAVNGRFLKLVSEPEDYKRWGVLSCNTILSLYLIVVLLMAGRIRSRTARRVDSFVFP